MAMLYAVAQAVKARRIDFVPPTTMALANEVRVQGRLFGVELNDGLVGCLEREVKGVGWQFLQNEAEKAYVAELLGVSNPTVWEVPELAKVRVTWLCPPGRDPTHLERPDPRWD